MKPRDLVIDRLSFQLGMIDCFAEMVAAGVKRLAISPPLDQEEVIEGKIRAGARPTPLSSTDDGTHEDSHHQSQQ
jgi:hypothetical protein